MSTPAFHRRTSDDEVRAMAALLHPPPWTSGPDSDREDRGVRAAFRRWAAAEGDPGLDLLAPVWLRLNDLEAFRDKQGWDRLIPESWTKADAEEVVRRTVMLLHLIALLPDEGGVLDNFGAACQAAGVSNGRFARLVNPPPDLTRRLEALSRAFRRFRQQNVRLRLIDEGETAKKRYAELVAFRHFLFTDDATWAVSRWARGYFWEPKEAAELESTDARPLNLRRTC